MGMRRIWGVLVLGLVLTACGEDTQGTPSAGSKRTTTTTTTTTSSTSAAPFEGEVLTDGEVVAVDKVDGVSLKSPDDGRLRNYGVATEVLDFGTADVVDAGEGVQYGAGEASTLLAFRIRVAPFADKVSENVTATVSVDGRQRSLPDFEYALSNPGEEATVQYVVAVPDDRREVELELKYAGLAQTFDLLDGERTGDQPDIMYRSPDNPVIYVENLTPAKLTVANDEQEPGAYVIAVTNAALTYFTNEFGDVPADAKKTWLSVVYEPGGEGSLTYWAEPSSCVLPFEAFTLESNGQTYPANGQHSTMEEFEGEKLLIFEVPADLVDAKLTVAPGAFNCSSGGSVYPYTVANTATIEITFPED
jgi:hypothetical protein